ncbi:hypothetical protein [Flavobacterium franklandianum]|uniref:hypothetical protein n=1 Tax=Flavobacterium franklandianum TaxID=2594430 RepID=UPI00163D901D|nr:hypothetical protein [Flavobacterium franklandianum]
MLIANSIGANLIESTVTVFTKKGEKTNSNPSYVNKNGAIGTSSGVGANGELKVTKSN